MSIYVKEGDRVQKGDQLYEGPLDLRDLLTHKGTETVEHYIINEVQKIYIPEGAAINDKHIEIIVRQMLSRVLVEDPGDSEFMGGETLEKSKVLTVNANTKRLKKQPAKFAQRILGITRVALTTESFLSAASFQETSRVLVNAAVQSKPDILRGLKENVIIGKLIPVGTGLRGIARNKIKS